MPGSITFCNGGLLSGYKLSDKYGFLSGICRKYTLPVWGVRGHPRTLPDGRITYVRPYPKGKNRKNPNALVSKEYKFVEEKIDSDAEV